MNATLQIGPVKIDAPAQFLVGALLERLMNGEKQPADTYSGTLLPNIGAVWEGGIYAGLSIHEGQPVALILLPGDESKNWADAGEWAKKQGGTLPSRIDGLVLFQNLKKEFREEWYWTAEQHASGSDYAWIQHFCYGNQSYGHKSYKFRARAVRRIPIR